MTNEIVKKICIRLSELNIKEHIIFLTKEEHKVFLDSLEKENESAINCNFNEQIGQDAGENDSLGGARYYGVDIYFILTPKK